MELDHPGLHNRSVLVEIPEIDRRQNHISQIDPNHSLLPIALDCLKDEGSERPLAHQLCERVADLKGIPQYRDSVRIVQDKDEVIRSKEEENQQLRQQLQERYQANRQLEREVGQLNQQFRQLQLKRDQLLQEKATQLEEKDRQLGRVYRQLEVSEQVVTQFGRRIAELEQQLSQREQKAKSKGEEQTSFTLKWREGKRSPCKMHRCCDAVVNDNTLFVMNQGTVNIYSYDVINDSWSQLPDCIYSNCSIAIINGLLTTVGGYSNSYSNELYCLTGEGSRERWMKKFPSMPTKRQWAATLCNRTTTLIVAGGEGEGGRVLSVVEVMDTETRKWSTAADLPQPMYKASTTVCGEQVYMVGGANKSQIYTKSAYTCFVSDLLLSCVFNQPESATFKKIKETNVWRQVADLPVTRSTCEFFHGRLLAIGGWMDSWKSTTAIYMYKSATNSSEIVSHMTTSRDLCITAVLPGNQLMVMGGETDVGNSTNIVELASV